MNRRIFSQFRAVAGAAALAWVALLGAAMPAAATVPVIDITVTPLSPSVSVSVAPKVFYATYNVTVKNNGPAISQFFFFGAAVAKDLANVTVGTATYSSSTVVACGPILSISFTLGCTVGPLAADETKVFTVTYQSPAVGNTLKFSWAGDHNLPPFDDQGSTSVALTTETPALIATGFTTVIPAGGTTKIFYTGVNPPLSPTFGGAATFTDPFTTTIVVPPIPVSTTANVLETIQLSSCSPSYGGCYESTVTIPVATFTVADPMVIYLRIDASRIKVGANLQTAVIRYQHGTNPVIDLANCADMSGGVPASGVPCVAARQKYPSTSAAAWKNDWEFTVWALDNGRFQN